MIVQHIDFDDVWSMESFYQTIDMFTDNIQAVFGSEIYREKRKERDLYE